MKLYSTQISKCNDRFEYNTVFDSFIHENKLRGEIFRGGMRLNGFGKNNRKGVPLVSVVMTVFNRESVVEKAICSVLTQQYSNIELVVVDGASSDGTLEILKKYEDAIDFIISAPDTGIYEGMNRAISCTTGDYILILNSDDWYVFNAIDLLLDKLLFCGADFVSGLAYEIDQVGNVRKIPPMPFNERSLFRMQLRHETMLISRKIYKEFGLYDIGYSIIGDSRFTSMLFNSGLKYAALDQYIMYFRSSGVSGVISDLLIKERARMIKENFPFLDECDAILLANNISHKHKEKYKEIFYRYKNNSDFSRAYCVFLGNTNVSSFLTN
jgi:glycosyltransferase involved in cell wall biosynthesis